MAFFHKKEEKYEPIESLIAGGADYRVYHMSPQDKIVDLLLNIALRS